MADDNYDLANVCAGKDANNDTNGTHITLVKLRFDDVIACFETRYMFFFHLARDFG